MRSTRFAWRSLLLAAAALRVHCWAPLGRNSTWTMTHCPAGCREITVRRRRRARADRNSRTADAEIRALRCSTRWAAPSSRRSRCSRSRPRSRSAGRAAARRRRRRRSRRSRRPCTTSSTWAAARGRDVVGPPCSSRAGPTGTRSPRARAARRAGPRMGFEVSRRCGSMGARGASRAMGGRSATTLEGKS